MYQRERAHMNSKKELSPVPAIGPDAWVGCQEPGSEGSTWFFQRAGAGAGGGERPEAGHLGQSWSPLCVAKAAHFLEREALALVTDPGTSNRSQTQGIQGQSKEAQLYVVKCNL